MSQDSPLEKVLVRDRAVVLSGLAAITLLSWFYLISMAAGMDGVSMPEAMAGAQIQPWSATDFTLMFLMWTVMMVAMMVPSAAPLILIYARVYRREKEQGRPFAPTGAFAAGYLLAWTAFSLVATVLQWALEKAALLSPMMVSSSNFLGALILVAAGIYQLTPLKRACLAHCRSPMGFIMQHWRSGVGGALRMGIEHGLFCVGCCWFLMGLLFVGGVMNLLWVAAITGFVLLEKIIPRGNAVAIATGLALILAGVWMGYQA